MNLNVTSTLLRFGPLTILKSTNTVSKETPVYPEWTSQIPDCLLKVKGNH